MLMRVRPGVVATPWLLLPTMSALLGLFLVSGPIVDVDSYWHVLMGRDIWQEHRLTGNPAWTFGPAKEWETTQWLSEVLMAGLVDLFGWAGLSVLRIASAVVIIVGLAAVLLPGKAQAVRTVVLSLVVLGVLNDVQERPAALSFAFLIIVAAWGHAALQRGVWPSWWKVAGLCVLWVNLHGYWVLLPVALACVAAARAAEARSLHGLSVPVRLCAIAVAAGACSPAGVYAYSAPLTFRAAASGHVQEWGPSTITILSFAFLLILAAAAAAAWARSRTGTAEILVVLAWVAFGALAIRNASPALIMVAPIIAARLEAAWAGRSAVPASRLTYAILGVGLVLAPSVIGARVMTEPRIPDGFPAASASLLASAGERRVLNEYALGGELLARFPNVRVAIDGRADRYGADTLDAYVSLLAAEDGWQKTLARYPDVTDAVLARDSALASALRDRGWREVASSTFYRHLAAPGVAS